MAIYGIGTDILTIARMERVWQRHPGGLRRRLLDEEERKALTEHADPARFLAKRFAVKEAFAKALGTGIRGGVSFGAIGLRHTELGQPTLVFSPSLQRFMAERQITHSHVSISDEQNIVIAFVILER